MLAGYYTIASGMLTRQRELDVIGNNLVNINTPGYRKDKLLISSFEQELLTRREAQGEQVVGGGQAATAAVVDGVVSLFGAGTLKETGRALDVAINGEGFFNVAAEEGTLLTRNGQFDIDEQGYLTLPGYGRVLGVNGAGIPVGSDNFSVEADGTVYDARGNRLGRLQITVPAENAEIRKLDSGLFRLDGPAAQNAGTSLLQGRLELSNVDMNQELTDMIEAQRAFQSCSSALQMVDAMNRKAASELASV